MKILWLVGFFFWSAAISPFAGAQENLEEAYFAGGCFWCTESDFEKLPGVVEVVSGYMGGRAKSPTYKQVTAGGTGHYESVRVVYDPKEVSYSELLDHLWRHIDPTDAGGQFVDRGDSYRSAIFYKTESEKQLAEASKKQLGDSGVFKKPIVTPIIEASPFYEAEEYHQDYYKKNPLRYQFYRFGSGRDKFLKKTWRGVMEEKKETPVSKKYSKPSDQEIRGRLNSLQYKVTQKEGTERPFQNEYWDNKKPGIYVDIVSGEPLFSSIDKFKSGTGWPSFTQPLEKEHVLEKQDKSLFMVRTEVRSKHGDSHLGHLFDDGPQPTGLRYCINSASLRFIPAEDLEKEGYGEYFPLFSS